MEIEFQKIKSVFTGRPIELAYLYGSFAEGSNRPWSDLDIALLASDSVGPEEYLKLEIEIGKKIDELMPGTESDVRIFNQAPLNYKIQVIQNGKLLYSANEIKRVDFETRVRDEYFDFLPKREEYRSSLFTNLEKGGLLWSTPKR